MGLEKVVERLEEVPPLYSLLTRSATGQPISTYFNLISGPRGGDERDGPREVHLVILDNGRSRIYQDEELRATLACIRCGACMNHCPVYTRVGGHAYQAVYPGPIGAILTPQVEGAGRRHELPHASSLCGACGEVCPVQIPIPKLLVRLRREASHQLPGTSVAGAGEARAGAEDLSWSLWGWLFGHPTAYRAATWFASRFWGLVPGRGPLLAAWTRGRSKPMAARETLQERAKRQGVPHE
jgi:L-lactate dehydrogenase complex protein LldF